MVAFTKSVAAGGEGRDGEMVHLSRLLIKGGRSKNLTSVLWTTPFFLVPVPVGETLADFIACTEVLCNKHTLRL